MVSILTLCVAGPGGKRQRSCAPHWALLGLAVALASCSVASIVTIIGEALAIAEQAAAITGVLPPEYADYVSAASECIAYAATEEASSDSPALKADRIAAQCAQLASVHLPPGTAKDLVALASRLAAAIGKILAGLPRAQTGVTATQPEKSLSHSDIEALGKISDRAHAAARRVRNGR